MTETRSRNGLLKGAAVTAAIMSLAGCTANVGGDAPIREMSSAPVDFSSMCSVESVRAVAASVESSQVVPGKIANQPGPFLTDGVQYTPSKDGMPAFCQVTGSFITNAATGKTANFLATLPENWNGKYLQLGCGGHCGTFAVSNAAFPTITITNQGKPGDILSKGYASFATDEGHTEMTGGSWALDESGNVVPDHIEDFLWRANKVLTQMGKEFTRAFYARTSQARPGIERSYFSGCSGGGRDALVAASYFPEEFDGIIAGSPYSFNMIPLMLGSGLSTLRDGGSRVSNAQLAVMNRIVNDQCDGLDGVKDGLIQNPAMCNFLPERDLPKCDAGTTGDTCFTQGQIEAISSAISAVTDEQGQIVQQGFSVSNFLAGYQPPAPPSDPDADSPWPDDQARGGLYGLADAALKVMVHENRPGFSVRQIVTFRNGGAERGFHVTVPRAEVDLIRTKLRKGLGHFPENLDPFIKQDRKLLIWHNLSDQLLTPYTSYALYGELASRHGGYGKLQNNVRLFGLPGTGHCSGGLAVGPGSFDAIEAMEDWVENGVAPNSLLASLYGASPMGFQDFSKPLGRSMPLCMFPQMARYKGSGDVNDAANWECRADDKRMLQVGESGRRAGLIR